MHHWAVIEFSPSPAHTAHPKRTAGKREQYF